MAKSKKEERPKADDEKKAEAKRPLKKWHFPEHKTTVEAASVEEALDKLNKN